MQFTTQITTDYYQRFHKSIDQIDSINLKHNGILYKIPSFTVSCIVNSTFCARILFRKTHGIMILTLKKTFLEYA